MFGYSDRVERRMPMVTELAIINCLVIFLIAFGCITKIRVAKIEGF